jgi:hypothetical protein
LCNGSYMVRGFATYAVSAKLSPPDVNVSAIFWREVPGSNPWSDPFFVFLCSSSGDKYDPTFLITSLPDTLKALPPWRMKLQVARRQSLIPLMHPGAGPRCLSQPRGSLSYVEEKMAGSRLSDDPPVQRRTIQTGQ